MMTVSQNSPRTLVQLHDTPARLGHRRQRRQRHPVQRQIEMPCELRARFCEAALGGEPTHQFRHNEPDRNSDRDCQCAEHRHATPAQRGHQRRRSGRCQHCAGSGKHDIEAGYRRAISRRRGLHDDGEARRHCGGEAEADDKAQHREQRPAAIGHETQRPGADAADEGAEDKLRLASPGVGQSAPDHRTADRANAAAVQDHRRLAVGEVPLRAEDRDQEADDQEVEELQYRDQRQEREVRPIASIERSAVEQRQQSFGCLSVHGALLVAPFLSNSDRAEWRRVARPAYPRLRHVTTAHAQVPRDNFAGAQACRCRRSFPHSPAHRRILRGGKPCRRRR